MNTDISHLENSLIWCSELLEYYECYTVRNGCCLEDYHLLHLETSGSCLVILQGSIQMKFGHAV